MLLKEIKGIGEKRAAALNKQGFYTPIDLLYFLPYGYVDTRVPVDIRNCADGEQVFIRGTVIEKNLRYLRKGLTMVRAKLDTCGGIVVCTWFNQKFIVSALNGEVGVYGTVERFKTTVGLKGPVLVRGDGIIPLYRPLKGVPAKVLREALEAVFRRVTVKSVIPDRLTAQHGLPELHACFRQLHFPTEMQSIETARRAIEIDRLAYELACFRLIKSNRAAHARTYGSPDGIEPYIERLPYRLTEGQQTALQEILDGMRAEKTMNRLLQGDVGCGKTVVALLAMVYAAVNGYQSALMAPTELLAAQHYRTALGLFGDTVRIACVTGSQTPKEREDALFHIRHGDADIVIGTHALLGENVAFSRLALIVVDEQHRFGVNQRAALEDKADAPDMLVMSATPIPRTVALTYYGDLEQSVITTVPQHKAKIATRLVPPQKREKMFAYLGERAAAGESSYIVCPRVEDESELTSAEALYRELAATSLAPYLGLLHGKQKEVEKRAVMQDYVAGKIRILVTTTVIEVGIDVPTATAMVILDAERYGLSQLHQLRGRVGRGDKDSYCFLLTEKDPPERLDFFMHCDDGFRLAEYDFRTRGAGDFLGTRQHGEGFAITAETIETARSLAADAVADPEIRADVRRFTGDGMKYLTLN